MSRPRSDAKRAQLEERRRRREARGQERAAADRAPSRRAVELRATHGLYCDRSHAEGFRCNAALKSQIVGTPPAVPDGT
jgi:hypothetical protein